VSLGLVGLIKNGSALSNRKVLEMGNYLKGKNAVVTGSGGGIGKAIALALADEGANIVVNDLGSTTDGMRSSSSPAEMVAEEIERKGIKAIVNTDSVAEYESAGRIIQDCIDNFGNIDILVNVAGNLRDRMCFNMSQSEWNEVIKVHLDGTFFCSRHACAHMREQKHGRIISVTSDAYRGVVGHVNYAAAKGGIVSLMRSMALELAKYNITCNSIAPVAATRMTLNDEVKQGFKKRFESGLISKETYEHLLDMPPPENVPPIVVYLASDESSTISGCVFGCGGGRISVHSVPMEIASIYKDYKAEGPWTTQELRKLIPGTLEKQCPKLEATSVDW